MEARLILALCLVLFSALGGKALADGVRGRAKALREIVEGLKRLRLHMTGMFEPVRGALEHSDCPLLNAIADQMGRGEGVPEAWSALEKRGSRRGGPLEYLTEGDRQILSQLFSGLGQTGREEQELLLASAIEAMDRQRDSAQARVGEADRLYGALGLLVGLMLALIVI